MVRSSASESASSAQDHASLRSIRCHLKVMAWFRSRALTRPFSKIAAQKGVASSRSLRLNAPVATDPTGAVGETREDAMPTYICQGRYSREAIQGMVKSPEDRTQVVAKLMKSVGGKLLSYYVTFRGIRLVADCRGSR